MMFTKQLYQRKERRLCSFLILKSMLKKLKKKRGKNPDPRDHSLAMMFFLGILATFPPFRIFLKLRGKRVSDLAENQASGSDQVPIIYVHGFRGGDYTTRMMVEDALKQKGDARFLKVEADLTGRIKLTGCYTGDKQPIIQLTFKDRIAGYQAINYYLSFILPFLSKKNTSLRATAPWPTPWARPAWSLQKCAMPSGKTSPTWPAAL